MFCSLGKGGAAIHRVLLQNQATLSYTVTRAIIIAILQMGKLRHRESNYMVGNESPTEPQGQLLIALLFISIFLISNRVEG